MMMLMRVIARRGAGTAGWLGGVMVALLALAGCTLPQDKTPPPQTYLLDATPAPAPVAPSARRSRGRVLLVTEPRAASGYDSNRIAYTRQPPKLDYYNDSVWGDTPAKMLLPALVRAFEQTGAFKAVVAPPAPVLANVRVDVDVIRLQQELMSQPSQVRLTARIKVVDMKSGHVLGTRVFDVLEPAPSDDAQGAARAAGIAAQRVLSDMTRFALQVAR
ncbi:MAG TPA: ABC-type transport auxiliary lipoprotein family protein [Candidatus Competibacteraceae bacterium]|nr:ABC-type transport auxiliary lipoprotein family protein [Candidatus Competibacteraceae bacterium]HQC71342.1 ABC-type transport auxiliary lipoprotein family protein [Candidatus Competibacteraceae bacterium]